MRKRALLVAVLVASAIVAAAGCGRKQSEVIARVNNRPITKTQLYSALEKESSGETARRMLDSLIVRDLIREEAKKRGIEVSKEELDQRISSLKDYILAMTGKDFADWLAETGQTEEDIAADTSVKILLAKLVITDTDRQKYFEDNKERLKDLPHNSESVIYREVVVGSEQEAEAVRKELLAQAKDGVVANAAFAKVAEDRTLDPNGRRRGGMAGWVIKGKGLDPKVEEVLFRLKPGEISEPVVFTPPSPPQEAGKQPAPARPPLYRVVMVDKHVTPGPVTLENNADIIEEWMLGEPRYQTQLQEFLANLRARADIQITDPRYKSLQEAYKQGREARDRRMAQPEATAPMAAQPGSRAPGRGPAGRRAPAAPMRGGQ